LTAPKHTDEQEEPIERCSHEACRGARMEGSNCVGHASDKELCVAVERWSEGRLLDARDARIDSDCLRRLLGAMKSESVEQALATRERERPRATACGQVRFDRATFLGDASFNEATFAGSARFDHATFAGSADFRDATFREHADFDGVTFAERADFTKAIFEDHAGFQGATFDGSARFDGAKFRSYADFEDAKFNSDAHMNGATFQGAHQFGPFTAKDTLVLDECLFTEHVTVDATAKHVSARSTIFTDGVSFSLSSRDIRLDCADFGRASTLFHATIDAGEKPRLTTLRNAQVAGLSISGIDLTRCRFYGAHGLQSLTIEPSCIWPHTPKKGLCVDREMIFEEQAWRVREKERRASRYKPWLRLAPAWSTPNDDGHGSDAGAEEPVLRPEQLAALYRALRKAGEDSNDQAGAGDLYYGEMEMRLRIPLAGKGGRIHAYCDRAVIRAYWLLAGYGLRASRAFIALAAVTLLAAIPLGRHGFAPSHAHPSHTYHEALVLALQSGISLLHPPETHLSATGQEIQIALRLAAPILLGLGALSLRSRVKR